MGPEPLGTERGGQNEVKVPRKQKDDQAMGSQTETGTEKKPVSSVVAAVTEATSNAKTKLGTADKTVNSDALAIDTRNATTNKGSNAKSTLVDADAKGEASAMVASRIAMPTEAEKKKSHDSDSTARQDSRDPNANAGLGGKRSLTEPQESDAHKPLKKRKMKDSIDRDVLKQFVKDTLSPDVGEQFENVAMQIVNDSSPDEDTPQSTPEGPKHKERHSALIEAALKKDGIRGESKDEIVAKQNRNVENKGKFVASAGDTPQGRDGGQEGALGKVVLRDKELPVEKNLTSAAISAEQSIPSHEKKVVSPSTATYRDDNEQRFTKKDFILKGGFRKKGGSMAWGRKYVGAEHSKAYPVQVKKGNERDPEIELIQREVDRKKKFSPGNRKKQQKLVRVSDSSDSSVRKALPRKTKKAYVAKRKLNDIRDSRLKEETEELDTKEREDEFDIYLTEKSDEGPQEAVHSPSKLRAERTEYMWCQYDEDRLLLHAVSRFGVNNWELVRRFLKTIRNIRFGSAEELRQRFHEIPADYKRPAGAWSPHERVLLLRIVFDALIVQKETAESDDPEKFLDMLKRSKDMRTLLEEYADSAMKNPEMSHLSRHEIMRTHLLDSLKNVLEPKKPLSRSKPVVQVLPVIDEKGRREPGLRWKRSVEYIGLEQLKKQLRRLNAKLVDWAYVVRAWEATDACQKRTLASLRDMLYKLRKNAV